MSEMIRVLHVVGRMNRGGTEALLMNLLHTVDRERFQYDFVEQTEDVCDYDEEILSLGSQIYRCPHISATSLTMYRKWWRDFYREHPEYRIIHGHSRGSAPIYLDEAKKAGRITILHCHNNSHGKGIKGAIRFVWQLPLRTLAHYNFACSYDSGISQFGRKERFAVIKNGIRAEKFAWNPQIRACVREKLGLENKIVIGNVARFVEQKNHGFLLEIFYHIQAQCPEAVLLLVGQGPLEEKLRLRAEELGISGKLLFAGVRSDVHELMQAMDVFVLPSLFEGLGIVNVEAQAAGLPCFVSDKVVPPEVDITNLMHHISLNASPEEWARQILAGMVPLKNRRNTTAEIVAAGFDIQSTCRELCDFYERVLQNA